MTVLDDRGRPVLSNENARALLEDPRAAFEVGNPALVEITRRIAASAEIRRVDVPSGSAASAEPPLAFVQGAPLPGGGMVATFTDVTSARKVASQLQASDERLESALEAAAFSLWELDLRQGTLYLAAATAALFGLPEVETVLPTPEFLRHLAPGVREELAAALRQLLQGRVDRMRIRFAVDRPGEGRRWLLAYGKVGARAADGSAALIVGTCKDLSEVVRGEEALQAAVEAVWGSDARLFINDHWREAIAAHAHGVHLGQEDLDALTPGELAVLRASGLRLGVSTHGYAEMLRADAVGPSYIALGAVFPTTLKKMATAPQGVARLAAYARLMQGYPLVAIGGIAAEQFAQILATGVGSIAVVRALVQADNPEQAAAGLMRRMG